MKVGDQFTSWEEFFNHLKEYEDAVYCNYYVRDSKTIEAYARRLKTPPGNMNMAVKYRTAYINCVKGGRANFRSRSRAIRKSCTIKCGCPAFINLKMSKCGQFLVIVKMNEIHGHPVSQSLYKASSQQRLNIDESILRKYQNALASHANKKVVQIKIFEETGKLLTLKDLTNIRSRGSTGNKNRLEESAFSGDPDPSSTDNINLDPHMIHNVNNTVVASIIEIDSNNDCTNNPLPEEFKLSFNDDQTSPLPSSLQKNIIDSINLLQDTYKCEVYVFADYKRMPSAIYFQDKEMKSMFNAYPEIIFVDSITNLLDNKATTYLIVVEDSHGRGTIVAVGILLNEQQETMDWFFKKFKETNPRSCDINIIMSDKDSTVRSSLRNMFPGVSLQICLFHTLQLFNHEISPNKMGISSEDTKLTKTYLTQLANCTSEHRYLELYAEMMSRVPDIVCGYFNRNWESIREEWALYATSRKRGFMNKTNNRVKNLNKLLRSVIQKNSTLQNFIKYFFVTLNSNRTNNMIFSYRKLNTVKTVKKDDSPEQDYEDLLTPFAFDKLKPNFEHTMAFNFEVLDNMYYTCHTQEGQVKLSAHSCNCSFFSSMGLPCHHVLSLRQCLDLPLFDKSLCLPRWTKEYTLSIHSLTNTNSPNSSSILRSTLEHSVPNQDNSMSSPEISPAGYHSNDEDRSDNFSQGFQSQTVSVVGSKGTYQVQNQVHTVGNKRLYPCVQQGGTSSMAHYTPVESTNHSPVQSTNDSLVQSTNQSPVQSTNHSNLGTPNNVSSSNLDQKSSTQEIIMNGLGFRILRKRMLSKTEKLSKMVDQGEKLAILSSGVTTSVFEKRMKVLNTLERIWMANQDDKLNEVLNGIMV
ncbi:hypothetical protein WDU94_000343 [Cyamophila willieti]